MNVESSPSRSGIADGATILAAVVMFAGAAVPARAQTPTVLYTFTGTTTDACAPRGNIVQGRDGNMYGGVRPAEPTAAARSTRSLRLEWKACCTTSRSNGPIVVALG